MTYRLAGLVLAVTMGMLSACSPTPTQETSAPEQPPAPDVASIHRSVLVLDAHADIEIAAKPSRYAGADGRSKVEPVKMQAGGVDAVVMAIAVGPGPRDEAGAAEALRVAREELQEIQGLAADPDNNVVIPLTADDLVQAHEEGKLALILGFQNARILGRDVSLIDEFYAQGVRVFALTHMGHNDFADSSRPVYNGETGQYEVEAEHGGLSELGRQAIERLNSLGAIVDVSQLSKDAALEVLTLTTAPVIASHSNVQALSNVRRNLSDEEIDAIGANGGVIHVAAFKGYLFDSNDADLDARIRNARKTAGIPLDYDYPYELYWEIEDPDVQRTYINSISEILGPGRISDLIDHLDYIVARVGVDHVGIGNDFNHGGGIQGFNDASEAMSVTQELVDRGYSQEQIAQIWGGNFLRVFRAAQAAAKAQ
jgi:membrane dipeptidase